MAEEDLIFGKNRHLFGGMEPSKMQKMETEAYDGKVRLHCQLPSETIINGQTLCTVAGAVIRGSKTGFPKDEFDGYLIADLKTDGCVIDTNSTVDETYYYAAFPYTGQGVYSRNPDNRVIYSKPTNTYLFGYNLNLADSNPDTRVEYPPDVMNAGYTPAKMNYSTGVFDYGSWPSEHGLNFMPRPCMLKYDGTVLQYLDPNDYTKQYNSTSSSSVTSPSSGANAMMEWPKIYTHREVVNGVYKFRCSNIKYASDWDCWCNYDVNNNVIDHFYTGIYPGFMSTGSYTDRLRSLSGFNIQSAKDLGQTDAYYTIYCKYASLNGHHDNTVTAHIWDVELLADRALIQDLLVLMAKTTNCTAAYGQGAAARGIAASGTMDKKGLFWGANNTSSGVKVFGMEHWWGNRYRLMNGLVGLYTTTTTGHIKFKITRGTHDGSSTTSFTGGGYVPYYVDIKDGGDVTYGAGYIDNMEFISPYGRLYANSFSGSSSTYETDVSTIDFKGWNNPTRYQIPYVGANGTDYGPFCMLFDYYGLNDGDLGGYTCATLSCKPLKE